MIASDDFNPYSSRYMCCKSMHVKKGAFILAIVILVMSLGFIGFGVTIRSGVGRTNFAVPVLTIIFVVLGIVGLANESPCLILCYAIFMIIQSIAACIISAWLLAIALATQTAGPYNVSAVPNSVKTAVYILLAYTGVVTAITIWATVVAFKAYRYTQAVRMMYPMGLAGGFAFGNAYNVVPLTSYQTGGQMQQMGGYPQQMGGYPQQMGGYPQQTGAYPQQMGGYPQQPMGSPQPMMGSPQPMMGSPQPMMGSPQPMGGLKPPGSPTPGGSGRSGSSGRSKGSKR